MLPDFIKVKSDLSLKNSDRLYSTIMENSLISKIRKYHTHEGDRWTIYREDGSQETKSAQPILGDFTVSLKEINHRGEVAIREAEYKAGIEVREKSHRLLFDNLDETIQQAGNAIDMKGKPLTAEAILELYEMGEGSFDNYGKWEKPTLIFHPIQEQRVKMAFERIENEPDLKERLEKIIERKREMWNVREANRKLVD